MEEKNLPLVSVPVVTYNSAKTVLETLDSIYNQTYPNIELIVSDDCSTDNTVEICREWIDKHKERFVRTELITVEKNTGVSANCNRSGAACRGEWSKGIAGDDIMLPNCIQDCMNYVKEHPDTICLFGKLDPFGGSEERRKILIEDGDNPIKNASEEAQLHYLIFDHCFIQAPTCFMNVKSVASLGVKNDERIPMIEDLPKWINILRAGGHFDFMDKIIVRYRLSETSLSTSSKPSKAYLESLAKFYIYYKHGPLLKKDKASAIAQYVHAKSVLSNCLLWKVLNWSFLTLVNFKKKLKINKL